MELRASTFGRMKGKEGSVLWAVQTQADPQDYGAALAQILRCREQFVNGFTEWSPCSAVPVWSRGDSGSLGPRVCVSCGYTPEWRRFVPRSQASAS